MTTLGPSPGANRNNVQQTVSQTLANSVRLIEDYRGKIPCLNSSNGNSDLTLFDAGMHLALAPATKRAMSEKYALKLLLGLCTAENLKNMHASYIEWIQGGIEAAGSVLSLNLGLNKDVKDLPKSIEPMALCSQEVFNDQKTIPFHQALALYKEMKLQKEIVEKEKLALQPSTELGTWFAREKRDHPFASGEQVRDRLFVHAIRWASEQPGSIDWDTTTPPRAAHRWPKTPGLARYHKFSDIRKTHEKIRARCRRLSLLIKGFGNHRGILLLFSDGPFRTA